MFYISKYNFEVNQNIPELIDQLNTSIVGVHDFENKNFFGISTPYYGQFNFDKFILSRSIKPLERISITPDAHIKLQKIDDEKSLIIVEMKFSEIWNLVLIFLHLIIISVGLFASHLTLFKNNIEVNWITRALIILMTLAIVNLFVWISFKIQTQKFKEIIQKVFF